MKASLMLAAMVMALAAPPARAQPAPSARCRPASKLEYQAAKQQFLLVNRFGSYVRTGRFWHHFYWYCHF
jgi:hypothetical protein